MKAKTSKHVLPLLGILLLSANANAANLIVNPGFDLPGFGFYNPSADPPQPVTTATGWVFIAVDGFNGISNDQPALGVGNYFSYSSGISRLETAPVDRPAITVGQSYLYSFNARNDTGAATGASVFIDWFDGGGTLVSSSSDLGTGIAATVIGDPFSTFNGSVTAPGGAVSAGYRVETGTNQQVVFDNFSLAIPEPSGAMLAGFSLIAALLRRRR